MDHVIYPVKYVLKTTSVLKGQGHVNNVLRAAMLIGRGQSVGPVCRESTCAWLGVSALVRGALKILTVPRGLLGAFRVPRDRCPMKIEVDVVCY